MSSFHYKIRDSHGKRMTGVLDAPSEKSAAEQLTERGYFVVEISKAQAVGHKNAGTLFLNKISSDETTLFFLQLGNMLKSGIPILKTLDTLGEASESHRMRDLLRRLHSRVNNGGTLSESMKMEGDIFPTLYTSMTEVGETSGNLGDVLGYVANLNEARSELDHQVMAAITYPIILLIATIAVAVFMVVWILPSFMVIFEKSGIALPAPTQFLYNLSIFLKLYYVQVIGGLIAVGIGFRFSLLNPVVKLAWNDFCLKIPVIGKLIKKIELARWTRSLALLLTSGVPILRSLDVAMNLTSNLRFQKCYRQTMTAVENGGRIADALKESKVVPGDVVQMVSAGENSGTLDEMLNKVASFYDLLVSRSLKKLTSALEPFFIVLMGAVVGFVMLSVLLPIFDMIKAFHAS